MFWYINQKISLTLIKCTKNFQINSCIMECSRINSIFQKIMMEVDLNMMALLSRFLDLEEPKKLVKMMSLLE